MRVTVEEGVAVDLRGDADHPFTRGFLCRKMARYLDRVYSPERLLHPLRQRRPVRGGDLLDLYLAHGGSSCLGWT